MSVSVLLPLSVSHGASARGVDETSVDPVRAIVLDRDVDFHTRDAVAASLGVPRLSADTVTIVSRADGRLQQLDVDGDVVDSTFGGWGTAWRVAKCTAAVGGFIAGNALLVLKVRKLGGLATVARRLVAAGSAEARWKAAAAFFGDVTGLGGVVWRADEGVVVLMLMGYVVVAVLATGFAGMGVLAVLGVAPRAVEERLDLELFAVTSALAAGAGLVGAYWADTPVGEAFGSAAAVGLGVGAATCAVGMADERLSRHPARTVLVGGAVLIAFVLGHGPT